MSYVTTAMRNLQQLADAICDLPTMTQKVAAISRIEPSEIRLMVLSLMPPVELRMIDRHMDLLKATTKKKKQSNHIVPNHHRVADCLTQFPQKVCRYHISTALNQKPPDADLCAK
jgi:hypothetical protein